MTPSTFVRPEDVYDLQHRLHGAFVALRAAEFKPGGGPEGHRAQGARTLLNDWNDFVTRPIDWLNAPAEFEHGRDLEARLATLQGDAAPLRAASHRVGEVLGMHTFGELSDLRDALSYTVGQLTAAYNDCAAQWRAADPATHDAWKNDFDAALKSFGSDWDAAGLAIGTFPSWLPFADAIPGVVPSASSAAWDAIVNDMHTFGDLDRRMRAAGICTAPTYADMPQPTHSDLDLNIYNWLGNAGIKGKVITPQMGSDGLPWVVGGLLAICAIAVLRR
jgi:hypothetical protein